MAFEAFPPYLPLTTLENAHSLYFALPWLKLGVGIIDRASIPAIANAFFNNSNSTYTFIGRNKKETTASYFRSTINHYSLYI